MRHFGLYIRYVLHYMERHQQVECRYRVGGCRQTNYSIESGRGKASIFGYFDANVLYVGQALDCGTQVTFCTTDLQDTHPVLQEWGDDLNTAFQLAVQNPVGACVPSILAVVVVL